MKQIALATADDPFYEKDPNKRKYFPEAIMYNEEGAIVNTLSMDSKSTIGAWVPECRDKKLKINDDRKIVMRFSALKDMSMVLLLVWAKQMASEEGEYDRSLFRLLNEDTNQTLDQSSMADALSNRPANLKIELEEEGEGEEEEPEQDEEEEGEGEEKPEKLIIVGRLYKQDDGEWAY